MTEQEQYAKGQADGRMVIEDARENQRDVSGYLAVMTLFRDGWFLLATKGDLGAALAAAYANGVLSCFD